MRFKESGKVSSPRKDEHPEKAPSPITSSDDAAGKWMDSSFEHPLKAYTEKQSTALLFCFQFYKTGLIFGSLLFRNASVREQRV